MPLFWIALNSINGLGPVRIKNLLTKYSSPENIFGLSRKELLSFPGITEKTADQLLSKETLVNAEAEIKQAESFGARIVTLTDNKYPPLLKEIFAPPPVLYIKGNLNIFEKHAVGIVGTRKFSEYGRRAASYFSSELTKNNIVIISGLAKGIDTISHKTCIENSGKTAAVLGCGIDVVYPASNKNLYKSIIENGALVSEFPMKTIPERFNFPRRNRIISGLSAGIIVVEAGERSGSLITAHYALQQGREIFSVPGSIFSENAKGTIKLLKNGAAPAAKINDILENIQITNCVNSSFTIGNTPMLDYQTVLNKEEQAIYSQLSEEPLRMDQLAEKTKKIISDLFNILLNLELKGFVRQIAGQRFVRA